MIDFAKCFTYPNLIAISFSVATFVVAYAFYRLLVAICSKLIHNGVWAKLIHELRYPVLLILLESAAILSLQVLNLPEGVAGVAERVITVLMIGTFGWAVVGIVRACYHNYIEKVGDGMMLVVFFKHCIHPLFVNYEVLDPHNCITKRG